MVYSEFASRVLLVHNLMLSWALGQWITVGTESHRHLTSFVLGVIEGTPTSALKFHHMSGEVTPAEVWVSSGTEAPVPQQLKLPLSVPRNERRALLCSASPGRPVSSPGCDSGSRQMVWVPRQLSAAMRARAICGSQLLTGDERLGWVLTLRPYPGIPACGSE